MNPDILVENSITVLEARHRGHVLVAGSHGGAYCAGLAAQGGLRAVVLNDAGIGLDDAGIGALAVLDGLHMPAATVSHRSARIGNGADMMARGVVSRVNAAARALGCEEGMSCRSCADRMRSALPWTGTPPTCTESRRVLERYAGGLEARGMDSVSLVEPGDAGHIAICGSHGGMTGAEPAAAIRADVACAAFNDAGIGIESAGITRLPVLDGRGIPAVAVDCMSARIGDAGSMWRTGVISVANELAARVGAQPGMPLAALVTQFARSR